MARTARTFSDLDLAFSKHPVTKDVAIKLDEYAVASSVRNIILTQYGERRFNPLFGSNIRGLLFDPADEITASAIRNEIKVAIENFEQRAKLDYVEVIPDAERNRFLVMIRFYLLNSIKPITTRIYLERLR
jgi:phage baseplate assembly protein W